MEWYCISRGAGYEIYRVTGAFQGISGRDIADKIDPNNWGWNIRYSTPEFLDIKIYID